MYVEVTLTNYETVKSSKHNADLEYHQGMTGNYHTDINYTLKRIELFCEYNLDENDKTYISDHKHKL